MSKNGLLAIKIFKKLLKFTLLTLSAIAAAASDDRMPRRHSALTAQQLYDEGLISDAEYARSVFHYD